MQNKVEALNKLKSLSLGLDTFLKKSGIETVKFHHVASVVYQSIFALINENNLSVLKDIFGDYFDDKNNLELMRVVLSKFVEGFIAAGIDDELLNRAYNNYHILDEDGRFPLVFEKTQKSTSFGGQFVIQHSFATDAPFKQKELVNVQFIIDPNAAAQLVEVVRKKLESIGLVIGRLTGKEDTTERHVSLALRIPYSQELAALVDHLNTKINKLTFRTAAMLKITTPPDIRTACSAVDLLDESSEFSFSTLKEWQEEIHKVAGKRGNDLPPLHVTHGNSPIVPARIEEIEALRQLTPTFDAVCNLYGIDFSSALKKNSVEALSKAKSSTSGIFAQNKMEKVTVEPAISSKIVSSP